MSLSGTPSLTEFIEIPVGGTTGQVLTKASNNDFDVVWSTGGGGGGSGTVTSVSIVSANGLSGSVANPTTTPAITLRVSALDASKIGGGLVSNTEFSYLDGVTSSIQSQFSGKQGNLQFQNQGIDIATSGGISTINFAGGAVQASATGSVLTVRCSAAGSSPLTTKGDLFTYSTTNDRLPVGTNGQILKSDSSQTTGIQWVSDVNTVGFSAISPTVGQQGSFVTQPIPGTITAWNIVADAGTATVKTWKIATGTSAPNSSNSINTNGVSLSTGTAIRSTTLTDFTTTTVSANDIFAFELTAVSGVSKLLFQLEITRS